MRPQLLPLLLFVVVVSFPRRAAVDGFFTPSPRSSSSSAFGSCGKLSKAPRTHTHTLVTGIIEPCIRCSHLSVALSSTEAEAAGASQSHIKDEQKVEDASSSSSSSSDPKHYDAVIVGGGPAGLLSAIMMAQQLPSASTDNEKSHQRQPRIVVYDRLPPPPPPDNLVYSTDISKYYLLGLGHRGQRALRHFGVWDEFEKASVAVLGRRGWAPGKTGEEESTITMANKTVTSRVLARDKLVGVLKQVIEERYGDEVELRYGWQVDPISFGNEKEQTTENGVNVEGSGPPVKLQTSRCIPISTSAEDEAEECSIEGDDDDAAPATITADFLIGTDGAARTIANAMEANDLERRRNLNLLQRLFGGGGAAEKMPFRVKRYRDDNPRVYKSVPIEFPSHWPRDLNYSARSSDNRVTFEALPSDADGNYCALLLMKPDDPLAAADCAPETLRQFFDKEFPQFGALLGEEVLGDVAKKGASSLPSFRYAGPRLHEGRRTVILGDCVHTVKPYFGLGANTALEDVQILSQIISSKPDPSQNIHDIIREFTKQRAADSEALVAISRSLDHPGKLGTMRFIIPLILDSAFHKFLPKVFAPGIFGMFQMENMGFRQIQRRKRLDRVMQSIVVLGILSGVGIGSRCLVKSVARMLGVRDYVVGGSLAVLLGGVGTVRKLVKAGEKK